MAFCAAQILELATDLHNDVGCPTSISPGYISGWLVQSGHLGSLNLKLGTCFYLSGSCIVNGFGPEEASIYSQLYTLNHYQSITQGLMTSAAAGTAWTALTEGDSKIVREGPGATMKAVNGLISENNKQLRLAIGDWKRNHSDVLTVNADDLASYPSPS